MYDYVNLSRLVPNCKVIREMREIEIVLSPVTSLYMKTVPYRSRFLEG